MSHKNYIAVYYREAQGTLTRTPISMSKESHLDHYRIGPVTGVEKLAGWPEPAVEWHGHIGYGLSQTGGGK